MSDKLYNLFVVLLTSFFLLSGCEKPKSAVEFHPVKFSELPNWNNDHLVEVWPAFIKSCQKIKSFSKADNDWQKVCRLAIDLKNPSENSVRKFFVNNFTPYSVKAGKDKEGLFTGYYEPEVYGSRTRNEKYIAPLYQRPKDLIMVEDLGIFRSELRGMRIAGRLIGGNLRPYFTHAQIDQGALAGNELIWVEDPVDAFFIQIQGSTAVKLDSGELIHLNYAGSNGHPYTSIGNVLIEQKALAPKEVSMQSIRAWLKEHPDQIKNILYQNASFVFFKEIKREGPIGNQGVTLTPGRSMAVDPIYITYGTPLWLDIEHPEPGVRRIRRLVIAQDRGGAIKGPIRGDFFWGTGPEAGEFAGKMKSKGTYYVLLPK